MISLPNPAADRAARDLLPPLPTRPLDSVRLTDELREEVELLLEEYERADELAEHAIKPRKRILLHGTPGNGKTTLAGAIAHELGLPGLVLSLSAVTGHSYIGEESRLLTDAFAAPINHPCVLLLDEVDAIAAKRSGDAGIGDRSRDHTVCALLQALDKPTRGLVLAATNRVDIIDPAVRRRFEVELEIPAPSSEDVDAFAATLFRRHKVAPIPYPLRIGEVNYDAVEKGVVHAVRRHILFGGNG